MLQAMKWPLLSFHHITNDYYYCCCFGDKHIHKQNLCRHPTSSCLSQSYLLFLFPVRWESSAHFKKQIKPTESVTPWNKRYADTHIWAQWLLIARARTGICVSSTLGLNNTTRLDLCCRFRRACHIRSCFCLCFFLVVLWKHTWNYEEESDWTPCSHTMSYNM